MRILKHAYLSLVRKPSKAIMIFGILFVVFAMIFTGVIINNGVMSTKNYVREEMGSVVDYTVNRMKIMKDNISPEEEIHADLSEEVASRIASDPLVEVTYINYYCMELSSTLETGTAFGGFTSEEPGMLYFSLVSSNQAIPYVFESGQFEITTGRHITTDEIHNGIPVAIITEELAAKNSLSIGDTIEFLSGSYEVIGIYSGAHQMNADIIYTSGVEYYKYITSIQFLLSDPLEVNDFISRNETKLPSIYNELTSGDAQYEQLTRPLDFVSAVSNLFIILVFVSGSIITIALVSIYVRDRRFEIGLLLSSGESKLRIIGQFITEVFVIALIAFALSMTISQLTSGYVSQWIAENHFTAEPSDYSESTYSIVGETPISYKQVTMEEVVSDFSAAISIEVILELMVSSMLLMFVAASIPLLIILNYKPREALQS